VISTGHVTCRLVVLKASMELANRENDTNNWNDRVIANFTLKFLKCFFDFASDVTDGIVQKNNCLPFLEVIHC
jgi:hypothetical protein